LAGIANVIGFDDGPFDREGTEVPLLGAVYARDRLDGVVTGKCTRDGDDGTQAVAELVRASRFDDHVQCVMIQGITVGGFNVLDVAALAAALNRPVLIVVRRLPRFERIRDALRNVAGGDAKWALIEAAGEPQPCGDVWIQWAGTHLETAVETVAMHTRFGAFPEPLRVAHLLAAAYVTGHSHGSA
jgi:hypothetical protein